ncbi:MULTISPECIES: ParA family protein [Streptomyces]|uniref:ParA family protein n=1 Tax=Streptomyces flavotricini TaxID=66888 RepID=A0ABS8EH82_9ACTN|nr:MULTISPECIES: ParA family protein [Streptomyces]MCC0100512.1 ParA family protein [Streptomyces flavotricini]WSI29294.1 ParA family protein [Streptomyces sp. NBC_01343]
MTSPSTQSDREKVVSKLPPWLRQELKIRTAQLRVDIQDAVHQGIAHWSALASAPSPVDTSGAESFSTWLPSGQWESFRAGSKDRGVSLIQGLAQAVRLWLEMNPAPTVRRPSVVRRIVVCNQKGGVGKTAITAGTAEALAEDPDSLHPVRIARQLARHSATEDGEDGRASGHQPPETTPLDLEDLPGLGMRVLLVDFDPQGHLTKQLGQQPLPIGGDSLTCHMAGEAKGPLADLIVPVPDQRFGNRLHLLPACTDAFLLDVRLSTVRAREAALERALAPVESEYDVILIDCPPSLGLSMDAAIYYGRRRDTEQPGASGALIVVQAEDSSADAYDLLTSQINDLRDDLSLDIDYLGLVVNLYDGRRGYIATSSLQAWMDIKDPRVVAIVPDLKEQREAVRVKQPLFVYSPKGDQAIALRALAREIS